MKTLRTLSLLLALAGLVVAFSQPALRLVDNDQPTASTNPEKRVIVARIEQGKARIPAPVTRAFQRELGTSHKLYQIEIQPRTIGGKQHAFLVGKGRTDKGTCKAMSFEVVREKNQYLLSELTPGQTCAGNPCRECSFQEDGWGCNPCSDPSDGECNHSSTSFSDGFFDVLTTAGLDG